MLFFFFCWLFVCFVFGGARVSGLTPELGVDKLHVIGRFHLNRALQNIFKYCYSTQ